MSFLDSIILGFLQGLTEFLPISSTGHLVIASRVLGLGDTFTFDVLLNFGTLCALIVYYRNTIWSLLVKALKRKSWPLINRLIVATIPAALTGFFLDDYIATANTMIWLVIAMLILVGILMIFFGKEKSDADNKALEKSISSMTSIKIGLAQALALIPGTSRSGVTILTGLKCNLSAKKAAEFSFLLAVPIIAGASLKTLLESDGLTFVENNLGAVLIGNLVSFVVGLLAIKFLIALIGKRGLKDFGWYRIGLALVLVILLITGII